MWQNYFFVILIKVFNSKWKLCVMTKVIKFIVYSLELIIMGIFVLVSFFVISNQTKYITNECMDILRCWRISPLNQQEGKCLSDETFPWNCQLWRNKVLTRSNNIYVYNCHLCKHRFALIAHTHTHTYAHAMPDTFWYVRACGTETNIMLFSSPSCE